MSLIEHSDRLVSPKGLLRTPPPSKLVLLLAKASRYMTFIVVTPTVLAPADPPRPLQSLSQPVLKQQSEEKILYREVEPVQRKGVVVEDNFRDRQYVKVRLLEGVDGVFEQGQVIPVYRSSVSTTLSPGTPVNLQVVWSLKNEMPILPNSGEPSSRSPFAFLKGNPLLIQNVMPIRRFNRMCFLK